MGQTGAGKSTLANVLLGEDVNCKNCTFPICNGYDSCTKETSYAKGKWLGQVLLCFVYQYLFNINNVLQGESFTIVDTPGFGDSDDEDDKLIDEMMEVLTDEIVGANSIVLLINGEKERFDSAFQQMLREMQVSSSEP